MANKRFRLGVLVIILVFEMAVVGCDNDYGKETTYDPTGIWDFIIFGQNATVTITGNNWIFAGLGTRYDDAGTFTRDGNIATLYSYLLNAIIGTATITSKTTITMTLVRPALNTGTFYGTKR